MKASGIVRRIDDLGRIVIPKEIRRDLWIGEGCPMEIVPTDEGVLLKKYHPGRSLSEMLSILDEGVEDMCKDLSPERTGDIRRNIREIQKILREEV